MAAHKILVIDDADAGRFIKVQTLRRAGFHVIEGATGAEALALSKSEDPDLIVLDVNLPDISGLEVSRRLRSGASGPPALPILQISNTAVGVANRVRGLEQGADVYLVEPVDGDVLIATVHALLRVRRAEKALAEALGNERAARKLAEEASRLKDDFIATLSHELRTPLNALMGWIWQLRHTTLSEEARSRALDSLERNGRMQAQLINDLLDVSRISKGKLQLEMAIVDLHRVVVSASEALRDVVERKQLTLSIESTPVLVAGDQGRLQQIVSNLLTNAIQFTPAGGQIVLTLSAVDDDAVISVRDSGNGIDAAFMTHVFDPFRQGEATASRTHGGLGLGLAVVRQLIELHGGSVSVSSPGLGKGATFTVRLPRETAAALLTNGAGPAPLLQNRKILVISEDDAERHALKAMLESSGAAVTVAPPRTAANGAEPASDIDVVVTRSTSGPELTFRRPRSPEGAEGHVVSASDSPAAVVRSIARFIGAQPVPDP